MILQGVGGKIICVDMVRPPIMQQPNPSQADLTVALLGDELDKVEQAMAIGDLEGAWDRFKNAAKGAFQGGKDLLNQAKEKLKGLHHHEYHEHHEHHESGGKEMVELTPEFYKEMDRFYNLFEAFFKAVAESKEKQAGTQDKPVSSLVYYVLQDPPPKPAP
jgi:hypothetical protein